MRAVTDGAVGGLLATAVMSAAMLAAKRVGLLGEMPPERIAGAVLVAGGRGGWRERERDALAVVTHFGFGAAMGALFALVLRRLRPWIGPIPLGLIYGSLVWLISYRGWVPALGIMPPPERDRPGRPGSMVVAHWIYGSVLGALVGRHRDTTRAE